MLLLNKESIKKVFTMKDSIESVKKAFMMFSQGKSEVPLRTNIQVPKHNGTLLFMPAFANELDCASLKIVNIYPDNINKGLPSSIGEVLLIDSTTGEIVSVMDGTFLTQLRTGAASGAAFDVLARKDARTAALIGTGGQAVTQLEAMLCVRNLDTVKIYDLDKKRLKEFAEKMREKFADYNTEIVAVASSDDAVEDADMLVTVTPSKKPVFDASKCKKGITISCVGAYQPHMQEMDPVILQRADKIFFDSKEAVLSESGDIIIPLEKGMIKESDFTGDLGDVLSGNLPGRERDEEIIVFETVGIGTQDLVTAKAIYDNARKCNVGYQWND